MRISSPNLHEQILLQIDFAYLVFGILQGLRWPRRPHISSSYAKILGEKLFRTWEILRSGSKAKNGEKKKKREKDTPGTAGGPGGRDRTLAVKS